MAVDGLLLEGLANALPRRPPVPKVGYRFLMIAGSNRRAHRPRAIRCGSENDFVDQIAVSTDTGSHRVRAMVWAAVGLRDAPLSAFPRLWRGHMV